MIKKVILKIGKKNIVIILTVFIVLILSITKKIWVFNYKYLDDDKTLRRYVTVLSKEKITDEKIIYIVEYDRNKFLLNISYDKENSSFSHEEFLSKNDFSYGDILTLRGSIFIPSLLNNPYEFNYKRYLNSNNIVALISTDSVEKIGRKIPNIFMYVSFKVKEYINFKVDSNITGKEAALYKSMMYGDDIYLEESIKNDFRDAGISHVLATSGMHMCYILIILKKILKKSNKYINFSINIIAITLFCMISNLSLSVIRAGIMSTISLLDDTFSNKTSSYKKLAISFIILILINPYYIFNSSFILSYLSTLGIISLYNPIYTYLKVKTLLKIKSIQNFRYVSFISNNVHYIYPVFNVFSLSLASFIYILPFQILLFGSVNIFSFVSNILITPVITIEFFIRIFKSFFINYTFYVRHSNDCKFYCTKVSYKYSIAIFKI